jgi:hypothetical protein
MTTRKKIYWISVFLILALASSIFFYVRSEKFQEERPDIELMLEWIDATTRYEDRDYKAEFAVWYLSRIEHESLYPRLGYYINANCYVDINRFVYGPGHYATRILSTRGDAEAIDFFLDMLTDPERYGFDPCLKFALDGMKQIGMSVQPVIIKRAEEVTLEESYGFKDERPDIEWMMSWIDTITIPEIVDYRAEFAVWYLSLVNHSRLYIQLKNFITEDCWVGSNRFVLGPGQYSTQILAMKGDKEAIEILVDLINSPSMDGPNPCRHFGGWGLGLIGEPVVSLMLDMAQDKTLRKGDRHRALIWLGEMGQDKTGLGIYCEPRMGCNRLGSKVGLQWGDILLDLLENDSEYIVRAEAARALLQIGDPRAIEAVQKAMEKEEDEENKGFYERLLEKYDTE